MSNFLKAYIVLFSLLLPAYLSAQSFQYINRLGGISSAINPGPDERVRDLQVDDDGNVYACGHIRQFADFNGTSVTTYGDQDIFIAKYDCHGDLVWVRIAGGPGVEVAFALALSSSGHIYLTGAVISESGFQVIFFNTVLTFESLHDIYLAKFDLAGNYLWGKFAGPGTQNTFSQGLNIEFNSTDQPIVHVSTATAGELFPGWNVSSAPYIVRFDTSGNLQHIFTFSSNYSLDAT